MITRLSPSAAGLLLLAGACAPAATGSRTPAAPAAPMAAVTPAAPLDRTRMPETGDAPSVDFPTIERYTLSNGLAVWQVEKTGLPLVNIQLLLNAGAIAEPPELPGLASLTAAMLTTGTTHRTATEIADEIEFLAVGLSANAGRETAVINLNTLTRNLEPALDVFTDVILNPAFDEREWDRVKADRLASIAQSRDAASVLASEEFSRRIFGATHPYGRPLQGTRISVEGMDVSTLKSFHRSWYQPTNATLIIVGDISAARMRPLLERDLAAWRPGTVPGQPVPAEPAPQPATRIYLIDRPGAAQSEIRIGHLGIPRNHPDYLPILVMNAILGGQFSSRINLNLREDKGYTYGASSAFQTGKYLGPFVAGGGVQTAVTRESIIEFMNELEGIRGEHPVTAEELE
ncbi:MAG: insulinase family protein, partial [Gemmatimonadota bacterium]|nr:insulinase family protein [Gemmatimonadota bacterium]